MRIAALSILMLPLLASEQVVSDWRLAAESRPTAVAFTWRDGAVERSGDDSLDQAWGLAAGYRWGFGRPGGSLMLVGGADVVAVGESLAGGTRQAALGRISAGPALTLGGEVLCSLAVSAAWGPGWMNVSGPGVERLALAGRIAEADLRAGVRWRIARRWSMIGEAGWMAGRDRFEGEGATWEGRRSGPLFAVGVTFTADPRPRVLE